MTMQQSEARREKLREEKVEAQRLGVSIKVRTVIDKTWTVAEDDTVRRLYPDYQAMADVLRHRSYSSLRNRADALGLRTKRHVWTTVDENRLKRLWASATAGELRSAFPTVTYKSIIHHGKALGLGQRGMPPLVKTGNWLCDAIRDRCRELGYNMIVLDQLANTGTYFQKGNWRHKEGHSWLPMVKAAKMLGGELRVEWPD